MAASEKVYVCGRCEDFGAPTLEELVVHMTNCGYPELRKKGEPSHSDATEINLIEENDNSEGVVALHILAEKKSVNDEKLEGTLSRSPISTYMNLPIVEGGQTSPTPFIWNKKTALLLLKLVKEHKGDMESPYIRRKAVWQKIAIEMLDKHGFNVSSSQCENKFKNMSNRYRKARDSNLRADGRMKQTCLLYNELEEYFRNDPRYSSSSQRFSSAPRFESRFKPKFMKGSRFMDSELESFIARDSMMSEGDSSQHQSDAEPVWVRRVVESIERCHAESMQMQREFIDVLKQIAEKK